MSLCLQENTEPFLFCMCEYMEREREGERESERDIYGSSLL